MANKEKTAVTLEDTLPAEPEVQAVTYVTIINHGSPESDSETEELKSGPNLASQQRTIVVPATSIPSQYPSARNPGQTILGTQGSRASFAQSAPTLHQMVSQQPPVFGKTAAQHTPQKVPQVTACSETQNCKSGTDALTHNTGGHHSSNQPMYFLKQITVNGQQYHTVVDINNKPLAVPQALQALKLPFLPLPQYSSTTNESLSDDEPLYVNAKQYHRILKRREARGKLEAKGLIPKRRQQKYSYESRHKHACRRARSTGGKFVPRNLHQQLKPVGQSQPASPTACQCTLVTGELTQLHCYSINNN